ncbi:MAG: trigger factor [Armatimonadota bacterium]
MQVTQEQTHPCEIDLRIEVEVASVNAAIDWAYKEFAKSTKVPGFRPGKTPRVVLEKFVGDEAAKEKALERLIQPSYSEALKETEIDPWAPAEIDLVEYEIGKPLIFTAKVPLAPKVELGEYKGLEVDRNQLEVTDEQVDAEIDNQRRKYTKFEQVTDRPAEEGDLALVEIVDEADPEAKPARDVVTIGESLPEMNEALTGMNIEEEKTVSITYPEDAQGDLAGQTKSLRVKILEIHKPSLPELTDEWVKSTYGQPASEQETEPNEQAEDIIDSVDKLRSEVREIMQRSAVATADTQVRSQIVSKVVENSSINFPAVMVKDTVDDKFKELRENLDKRGISVESYLKHIGKTAEQLEEQFSSETEAELKVNLALYEIIEKEGIKVEDSDIEAEITQMSDGKNLPEETLKAYVDSVKQSKDLQSRLLHKKVLDFLVSVSNIKDVG